MSFERSLLSQSALASIVNAHTSLSEWINHEIGFVLLLNTRTETGCHSLQQLQIEMQQRSPVSIAIAHLSIDPSDLCSSDKKHFVVSASARSFFTKIQESLLLIRPDNFILTIPVNSERSLIDLFNAHVIWQST